MLNLYSFYFISELINSEYEFRLPLQSYLENPSDINSDIDKLFFTIDGALNKEYSIIFKSLFQDKSKFYTQVIDFLSTKQSGYTQKNISEGLDISAGRKIKEALDDLVECGFIMALSKYNSKINTKYMICDPFILFYLKWLKPYNKNDILNLKLPFWSTVKLKQEYSIWCGFAFETVCLANIDLYLNSRQTKGLAKSHSYWSHKSTSPDEKGAQIDILIEYENNIYDLVECKFYNKEFTISKSYKEDILNKISMFEKYGVKGQYDIKFVMLSTYGCIHNEHYNSLGISADIKIEDLIK